MTDLYSLFYCFCIFSNIKPLNRNQTINARWFTFRMWTYLTKIIIFSAMWKVLFLPSWCFACKITQWWVETGIFILDFPGVSKSKSALLLCNYCATAFYSVCCMALTLFICGDVELNPGPKNTKSPYYFSLCHWNLNSIPAHDFSKLSLIESYNTHHNFDMICLSETYFDSSYADDDTRLN